MQIFYLKNTKKNKKTDIHDFYGQGSTKYAVFRPALILYYGISKSSHFSIFSLLFRVCVCVWLWDEGGGGCGLTPILF